jgi:hypothetical protein
MLRDGKMERSAFGGGAAHISIASKPEIGTLQL